MTEINPTQLKIERKRLRMKEWRDKGESRSESEVVFYKEPEKY